MSSRWQVQIVHPVTGKPHTWDTYDTRERAEDQAARLRVHKFFAQVRRIDSAQPESPEHRNERRRFLCWAVMCGFAQPERLTDGIVVELAREAQS